MKSTPLFIEPLEARVAPALLVNGANLLGGAGNPASGETSTGANTVTLVKVLSGQALVFFNNGVITGISVGAHAKLDITGDVQGDIVSNLGPNGRLTDSDNNPVNGEDGGILLGGGIRGITTHKLGDQLGSVGRIISGAVVKNVNISGEIAGIYAGDGIFRNGDFAQITTKGPFATGVDINSIQPGVQDTYSLSKATAQTNGNASIKNVTVNTARQLEVFAGSGDSSDSEPGKQGSTISNVTVVKTLAAEGAKPVVFLHAGDGGTGTEGGVGGSITSFNDQGSTAYVRLQTGNGGDALSGTGGAGGSLRSSTIVSSSARYDLIMGNGGSGAAGGVGGGISTLTFTNTVTGGKSLVALGDLNNDGLSDVVTVNALTGESVISLGTTTSAHLGEANFAVALQTVAQANGTVVQTPFLPSEGANPTSVVLTDLNGDGLLDFAVSYASTNSLGTYLNHGGGSFGAARLDLAVSPTRLVAGDFAGLGHDDLAIVSAGSTTTQQGGVSTQVFLLRNDGAGNLALSGTAAVTLPGTGTDAVTAPVYDTAHNLLGTNLYVGFTNGSISPVLFRGGGTALGQTINAFTNDKVPVDGLDATDIATSGSLLAFSKDINAQRTANGDTTVIAQPEVIVYGINASGTSGGSLSFNPTSLNEAHFLAGGNLVGTVSAAAVSAWAVTTPGQYTVAASLASNGALNDFASVVRDGTLQIAAVGAATNRFFFANGNLGGTDDVSSFLPSETPLQPQAINFHTGDGGNGDGLAGGNGGTIKTLTYTQTLGGGVLEAGGAYNTVLTTGHGGNSNAATGGAGGAIKTSNIQVTPAFLTYTDDTSTAIFQTGAGGDGVDGGKGGTVTKATVSAVYQQTNASGVILDSVAVRMLAGDGGRGTGDRGGAGGSVILNGQAALNGVSFVDDDSITPGQGLVIQAGNGGDGVAGGGNGGNLTNVGTQNAAVGSLNVAANQLTSASLTAGNGGNASAGSGGNGGNITKANTAVAEQFLNIIINDTTRLQVVQDGAVTATAGDGGTGRGGAGGIGGSIISSNLASGSGDLGKGYGVLVKSGDGGNGDTAGGTGGGINKVTVNGPADTLLYAAVIAAGNGGDALSAGVGGRGGNIQGVKQTKDINSAINVIQAGNGGEGAGDVGGEGGSVSKVRTLGFLGLPSTANDPSGDHTIGAFFNVPSGPSAAIRSLFDSTQIPQGIFAGRGGSGAENGAVFDVVARQIAAIGASVRADGSFNTASSISRITADLIGYEVNRDGVFASSNGGTSPSTAAPVDGFILGSSVSEITTLNGNRTDAFTFTS